MIKIEDLKIKSTIFSLIFIIFPFLGNSFNSIFASQITENILEKEINLDLDYLKNVPTNYYIIGPGDELVINISRDYPELINSVTVDGEGIISLPKVKRIFVEGLTINELISLLNKAYAEYIKYPDSEIFVSNYRPIRIYIEGEVTFPGLQTLGGAISISGNSFKSDTKISAEFAKSGANNYFPTVFDAIRSAGGITQYSNLEEVEVIRINKLSSGGGRKKTVLNFSKVISGGDDDQNIRIYDGDTIRIKRLKKVNTNLLTKATYSNLNPRFIEVFVSGRVNSPGKIKVSKLSTLNDAIDIAGGAMVLKGKTRFIRFRNDGTIDNRQIAYSKRNRRGTYQNPFLREGDLILIDNSLLTQTNEVIKEFTAPFAGIFSTYGLIKAISD